MLERLQFKVSEVAYHLEQLSDSKIAIDAVENKNEEAFREVCKNLHIPKKFVDIIMKIVFSFNPIPTGWPWP